MTTNGNFDGTENAGAFHFWIWPNLGIEIAAIGRMRALYDEKILSLQQSVMPFPPGGEAWMEAIIRYWFGFASPKPWQIQNSLHLYHRTDVFLTSSTRSRKTILMLASVIAQTIMDNLTWP